MGIFGAIKKAVTAPVKAANSVVSAVAKPVGKAIKPATNLIRDAAVKATANTPLGGAVANMAKLDFAKNPLKAVSKATVENFKGAAELGKGLVAARVGGAVQGAVSSSLANTPLAGMGIDRAIGNAAKESTASLVGNLSPGKSRGGDILKTGAAYTDVKSDGAKIGPSIVSAMNAKTRAAAMTVWDDWAGRKETLGGVLDDG